MALVLPVLAVTVAVVVELAEVQTAKIELQNAADSAAIKGAQEFELDQSAATTERARVFADNLVIPLRPRWTINTTATADATKGSVTITQAASRSSLFGNLVPPGGFHLSVSATAMANSNATPLCVLALHAARTQILRLQSNAAITASGCLVQSDSDLTTSSSASLTAGSARSVGGASGNISPPPVSDAPSISDPFSSLPINVPSTCSDLGITVLVGQTATLQPGVHCGIVTFDGIGTLILAPGEHYFVNSAIIGTGNAQMSGTDVVMILSGTTSLTFSGNAGLSLEGRRSGSYAGFVLVSDRHYTSTVAISTSAAHNLLGTIYLPVAGLEVSGSSGKVADASPWTVVVADHVLVDGSANLTINSNYSSTVVPVPSGVGPPAGSIQLTR